VTDRKSCFVVGPIGEENSTTRDNADTLLHYVIKAALVSTYDVTRADDISKPGDINDRDARAAALMRPWTQEIAMQQAWEPRWAWTGSGAMPQGRAVLPSVARTTAMGRWPKVLPAISKEWRC
jgi:hypothetical protein